MFLIDTNVISELRKKGSANEGVKLFFQNSNDHELYMSAITIGELRRGVELIRHRGDEKQARKLSHWLGDVIVNFESRILDFTHTEAQVWGKLRVPNYENLVDKQIAATALTHDLTIVTRNERNFSKTGARILNPFY